MLKILSNNQYILKTLKLERNKCKKYNLSTSKVDEIPYQNVKVEDYKNGDDMYDDNDISNDIISYFNTSRPKSEHIEKHGNIIDNEEANILLRLIAEAKCRSVYNIHTILFDPKLSATNNIIDEENDTAELLAYAYDRLIDFYTKKV
jgi:hypothetical protein